jgi:hypothetical protein
MNYYLTNLISWDDLFTANYRSRNTAVFTKQVVANVSVDELRREYLKRQLEGKRNA